jgi:hypothetical protein
LAALATRYLPGIKGRLSLPPGTDQNALLQFRASSNVSALLQTAGFDPQNLRQEAEELLLRGRDPLAAWVPLLRYASYDAWSKLRGEPLYYMWRRVAAEVLLRAHEELVVDGMLEPLPDLTNIQGHTSFHDRLTPRQTEAQTLERALMEFGLSPHPRVLLILEGETEFSHVPRLLEEMGLTQPQQVRVQITRSSRFNAHLIARYMAPRVGKQLREDLWALDAPPTALVIAMDPENDFATAAKRDEVKRKLKEAIREEVRFLDADISQQELDNLVHVFVWGEDSYELANFSDDELVSAIATLMQQHGGVSGKSPTWEQDLRTDLRVARSNHDDIKIPVGKVMRRSLDKVALAELLWPALQRKYEAYRLVVTFTGVSAVGRD